MTAMNARDELRRMISENGAVGLADRILAAGYAHAWETLEDAANQIQKDNPANHVVWLRARAADLRKP